MKFECEVGGKSRVVDVSRQGSGYLVTLDGQQRQVDVAITGRRWSLLIGTRSYDVAFVEEPGALVVQVNGQPVRVSRGPADGRGGGAAGGSADTAHGPQRITAPMPGRIVKLLVKPGDAVAARQGVVVVEAMKMENELRSPRAGIVTEVRVTEGTSVEARTVLVVVD